MKRVFGLVLVAVLGMSGCAEGQTLPVYPGPVVAGGVEVDAPVANQIFQRQTLKEGVVHVAGKVTDTGADAVVITVSSMDKAPRDLGIAPVTAAIGDGGKFEKDVTVPAGAWYEIGVRASSHGVKKEEGAAVAPIGMGEVFVTGGQSNSTNFGEVKTKSETGMVMVFDGKGWSPAADPLPGVDGKGGGPWCVFGDLMAERYHVPIGIVPVGKGSTSVRQWLPKGDVVEIEPSRTYGLKKNAEGKWVNEGTLYDRMVERMKQLGPHGFRAMLWHQGESDAHQAEGHTLPGKDYRVMLERVITESRKEVGWNVPWFVATASWGSPQTPDDPDTRAAQAAVVSDGVAMAGPDTDKLVGEFRQKNGTGVHFSEKGLHAHGGLWVEVVGKWIDGPRRRGVSETPE